MGLDREECWCRSSSFNWFGHQSRFDVPPPATCWKGHLVSVDIYLLLSWRELLNSDSFVSSGFLLPNYPTIKCGSGGGLCNAINHRGTETQRRQKTRKRGWCFSYPFCLSLCLCASVVQMRYKARSRRSTCPPTPSSATSTCSRTPRRAVSSARRIG